MSVPHGLARISRSHRPSPSDELQGCGDLAAHQTSSITQCIQQADVFNKEVYLEVYSKSMIQHSGLETQSLRLTASRAMAGDVRASLPSTLS